LIQNFEIIFKKQQDGESLLPYINENFTRSLFGSRHMFKDDKASVAATYNEMVKLYPDEMSKRFNEFAYMDAATTMMASVVKKNPNISEEQVIHFINKNINGVKAWGSADFRKETVITVLSSSGIAISFGTLIIFALIVGFVIIGLTLYSAAVDRLRDYGTLKAIGATNGYIARLIITQAMIFGIVGFSIGFFLVNGFKNGIANAGTIFEFPFWLEISFLVITLFIALSGSFFAVKRITSYE
jgi:putative ABC transport system permease protein